VQYGKPAGSFINKGTGNQSKGDKAISGYVFDRT